MQNRFPVPPRSVVAAALRSCRGAFLGIGLFSGMINILMLTGPLFMLQVYDRVLASRSVPTLVVLLGLVAVLYAFQGALDFIRSRLLLRIGNRLDRWLSDLVFDASTTMALRGRKGGDGQQPVRDLDQLRQFLGGQGPVAIFDMPWMPLYLVIVFLFHTWLGILSVIGVFVLCTFALLTEFATRGPTKIAVEKGAARNALTEAARRNIEVVTALGMTPAMKQRWVAAHGAFLDSGRSASDAAGGLTAASKTFRLLLQSLTLAAGAYLAIQQEISAGAMIAVSIISSRALAPIELAIANWKGFVSARQSYRRLGDLAAALLRDEDRLVLPPPTSRLEVENLAVAPPGQQRPTLTGVIFSLAAGEAVGVIGPSGSGKSTLARALVGAWPGSKGGVRLDGAALDQWAPHELGRHIGYLPQDIELFDGTVAENIARFRPDWTSEEVVAAATYAGAHDLIVRLPEGYGTRLGDGGIALSAGQRQRIALSRALYGDPFLIVLDEPNSNLDAEGDAALTGAIRAARERGRIVVVIAHRPSALVAVDRVLVLADGRQQSFGPKEEVLGRVLKHPVAAA
ncbi:type I secretion system permease/ATPase [Rhodospirillaceae bacterium SYSU D60014]|uniref:type I secretion system permease/ATPase n=1 Tax=Virgifigura deserti TaxID=2268457 RepID=UPI000E6607A8